MKKVKSVCVYCGTGAKVDQNFKDQAANLGKFLAKEGIDLVYGGGLVGLMGIVSQSSFHAGGKVIGIIPEHIQDKEIRNDDLTEIHVVDNMHTRKKMMMDRSEAFIILPGGFGTLEEAFEVLTWKYLGLHDKPIVFINVNNFYDHLETMVKHMIDVGFTPAWQRSLYHIVDTPEEALIAINAQPQHIRPNTDQI